MTELLQPEARLEYIILLGDGFLRLLVRYCAPSAECGATAEIKLDTRTIIEYLLSPVTGAFQEAARER